MLPQIDPYTLRLYVIIQASFVFCVILSAVFASISEKPKTVFLILSLNSFAHLLLDALEIKTAAGVHLIAPFSWELVRLGLIWPEHVVVTLLTIVGLSYTIFFVLKGIRSPIRLSTFSIRNILLSSILLVAYFILPIILLDGPAKSDNHYVNTLREKDKRVGREIHFDRALYAPNQSGGKLFTFAGEELDLTGQLPLKCGVISIRGIFIDQKTIQVLDLHENCGWFRDMASYIALFLFSVLCVKSIFRRFCPT